MSITKKIVLVIITITGLFLGNFYCNRKPYISDDLFNRLEKSKDEILERMPGILQGGKRYVDLGKYLRVTKRRDFFKATSQLLVVRDWFFPRVWVHCIPRKTVVIDSANIKVYPADTIIVFEVSNEWVNRYVNRRQITNAIYTTRPNDYSGTKEVRYRFHADYCRVLTKHWVLCKTYYYPS